MPPEPDWQGRKSPLRPRLHIYTITFPSAQDVTNITFWNRQDGCCPERLNGMLFEYFDGADGTENLIGSQQVDNLALDNPDTISTLNGASFEIAGPPPPTAPFVFTSVTFDPLTREVEVKWNSRPGFVYAIDSSPDLRFWSELDDGILAETESASFAEILPADGTPGRIFYQVRELGPG